MLIDIHDYICVTCPDCGEEIDYTYMDSIDLLESLMDATSTESAIHQLRMEMTEEHRERFRKLLGE